MPQDFISGFSVTQQIPTKNVLSLLCSAFEGGSNYWYNIEDVEIPSWLDKKDFKMGGKYYPKELGEHWSNTYLAAITPGCHLMIADMEDEQSTDEKPVKYKLDFNAIQRGLNVMAEKEPHSFASVLTENDDAITGDVFLQCCLFGEVKYG